MDLSETLTDVANHRLKSLPVEVAQRARFVQGDLRQFDLGQRFPFIFIFFGGFEHLTELEDYRSSLNCIRQHLEPDGLLEIEFMAPSGPKEYFEEPRIVDKEQGRIESLDIDYTERTTLWWLDAKRYCWKTRMWVRHDDGRSVDSDLSGEEYHECQSASWAFTLEEIPDLMSECGFKVEQILGAHEYPLRPPEPGDAVWIVDARPA